jgi:hypothetical protein
LWYWVYFENIKIWKWFNYWDEICLKKWDVMKKNKIKNNLTWKIIVEWKIDLWTKFRQYYNWWNWWSVIEILKLNNCKNNN